MRAFRGAIRENLALALLLISRHLSWRDGSRALLTAKADDTRRKAARAATPVQRRRTPQAIHPTARV
jgi:hypothetical protein